MEERLSKAHAHFEKNKMEWAKKVAKKKGMNDEQAAAFYKHVEQLSFGKRRGRKGGRGKGGKGGRGGRGGKGGRGRKL